MGQSTAEQSIVKKRALVCQDAPAPGAEVVLRRMAECMAHHVNNALTGVIGYLELSLRDSTGKGAHQAHLQAGLACAYQAADTVKRLVAVASQKSHAGAPSPVSLRRLAEDAAQKITNLRGSAVQVTITGEEDVVVLGNPTLLRTALEQIVRNAVDAMPKEGTLAFHLEERIGRGYLFVRDSGPGFSEEALAHLFEPFWTMKTNGHLGLGLVLCRDTVHAQGGLLTVDSTPGAGATVTFSLPAAAQTHTALDETRTILAPSTGTLVPALI
jgi:signal transduction histidine kinase